MLRISPSLPVFQGLATLGCPVLEDSSLISLLIINTKPKFAAIFEIHSFLLGSKYSQIWQTQVKSSRLSICDVSFSKDSKLPEILNALEIKRPSGMQKEHLRRSEWKDLTDLIAGRLIWIDRGMD